MAEEKKTKKRHLTVAKADKEEFERVWGFVHVMENLFDTRGFLSSEEDWRDWPDEDEDKQELLEIEKQIKDAEGDDWNGHADNRLILYTFMKRRFKKANYSGSFGRILFDCETLIDNCCDPELDYLEFKPEILHAERIAVEKIESLIRAGEGVGHTPKRILDAIKEHIETVKKDDEEED